ncbi:thermonuclease family protein [Leptolyngbya ohadii]|uniref:thermonuclease family protein n=1 Tax=Leptolyngbya ohadii TaxID=1962290 RepID=UPI000B599251|nr:thermonuclease family protein [Leptolyngbya ohadii]
MKFALPSWVLLLFLAGFAPRVAAQSLAPATIVSTGDGDTLRINQAGRAITVRLVCIDSPESQQPGGTEAANRLRQLLPPGQAVQVRSVETDRYGRLVAEIYRNGRSVNLQMVQEGMSVVYRQYLSGCAATQNQYLQGEAAARAARRGFWAQSNPTMPWDWRQGQRPNSSNPPVQSVPSRPIQSIPSARPTPAQPAANLPACTNSDCDCSDFASQAEAQRVFNLFPGDPFRLDGDGDGRVCEGR